MRPTRTAAVAFNKLRKPQTAFICKTSCAEPRLVHVFFQIKMSMSAHQHVCIDEPAGFRFVHMPRYKYIRIYVYRSNGLPIDDQLMEFQQRPLLKSQVNNRQQFSNQLTCCCCYRIQTECNMYNTNDLKLFGGFLLKARLLVADRNI